MQGIELCRQAIAVTAARHRHHAGDADDLASLAGR